MTEISLRPGRVVARLRDLLADAGRPLRGSRIHVVGVAYKPGVADVRESPALEILTQCQAAGAEVSFSDSHVEAVVLPHGEELHPVAPDQVAADVILVHTRHPDEDLDWIARHPLVLDTTFRLLSVPHRLPM